MKFMVLKHHWAEDVGSLAAWFKANGHTYQCFEFDEPLPEYPDQFDGLIVLGGPMHVDPKNQRLAIELDVINHFIKHQKPTLGICLGAQLIAYSLGALITPMERPENGWCVIRTSTNKELVVAQWHSQQFTLPAGALCLASSEQCKVQMFKYQHHVLATQFHPEWNNEAITQLQQAFGIDCPLNPIDEDIQARLQDWWFQQLDEWLTTSINNT